MKSLKFWYGLLLLTLSILVPVKNALSWDKGFNFRSTSGFVTDNANETYVVGDTYPTTRNSVTFGFTGALADGTRDRDNTIDVRLAGCDKAANNSTRTFQIDLPSTGGYTVYLAIGDALSDHNTGAQYVEIFDNVTSKLTINDTGGTTGGHFDDATGADLTSASWPGSNAGVSITFASTTMNVVIGSGSGLGDSTLAHLRVVQNSTGSAVPIISGGDM